MKKGEVLQVIADCPQSFQTVPEEITKHGYTLLGKEKQNQDLYFTIKV